MTIGAISSLTSTVSYSTATEYEYFGTTFSDSEIQQLLSRYGITQTGNSDTDLRALYEAMYSQAKTSANSAIPSVQNQNTQQNTQVQNSSNVPWANLMSQVQLTATGDLKTDYKAFTEKINTIEQTFSTNSSTAGLAYVNQLNSEAQIVFSQSAQASTPTNQTPEIQKAIASGADIKSQLNRMLIIGIGVHQ
jgi:hypothetical protein